MTVRSILLKQLVLASATVLSTTGVSAQQQWQNVGSASTISAGGAGYINLLTNSTGTYSVSYYDVSVAKGSVQQYNGTSWSYAGGVAGITTGTATFSSLAQDSAGNLYYSNQVGYPGSGMEVRKFSGGGWSSLTNPTSNTVNYQAIAISSSDVLFAFNSEGSGNVKRLNNGVWEQVGNTNFAGGATYAKMVIGSDNNIYVAQIASGLKVYKIATNATSTDTWTLVGGVSAASAYSSDSSFIDIALDSNNTPYISYVSSSAEGKKLNVKKFDGTNWVQVGPANFSDTVVNYTAIAVAPNGSIYTAASVWDSSNANHGKNSVYTYNSGSNTWTKVGTNVISDGAATYNDLAVDSSNKIVLAYSDGGLKVKTFDSALLAVRDVKSNTENIKLYPNPVTDYVYVIGAKNITKASVYSISGQLISPDFDAEKVNVRSLKTGSYVLNLMFNDGSEITKKILKK